MSRVQAKAYEQLVKSKRKEMTLYLIKSEDYLQIIEEYGEKVSEEILQKLRVLLQIDAKYQDVFQVKLIQALLTETQARVSKEH